MPGPTPVVSAVTLPKAGRKGRPPTCPYDLASAGEAWWRWAWRTPQASQWDAGSHYLVGRRAQLEDSLAALDQFDPGALETFFEGLNPGEPDALRDALTELGDVIGRLQSLAGGRLAVLREIRELDDRLGLSARAMQALKWTLADDKPKAKGGLDEILAQRRKREAEAAAAR